MPLTIAVYSDVVCPWCHLGKKRLEEGLRRAGLQDEAQIVFLPYELNPDMPEEGIDRDAYLTAKFGREKLGEMFGRLDAAGEADGVRFDWAAMKRMPNTRKAHVLIALANGLDVGPKVKGELMAAFFEQGRDIGDEEVLIGIGAAAGLSRPKWRPPSATPNLAGGSGRSRITPSGSACRACPSSSSRTASPSPARSRRRSGPRRCRASSRSWPGAKRAEPLRFAAFSAAGPWRAAKRC